MIKQDIHIYVSSGRPNGWTEWADIFCGHSWVARLKIKYLKKKIPLATLGPSVSIYKKKNMNIYKHLCIVCIFNEERLFPLGLRKLVDFKQI